jgi:hypothetical protein
MEFLAGLDDFGRGRNALKYFDDHAVFGQEAGSALQKRLLIGIDECFCRASQRLEIKEHGGIHDDAVRGVVAAFKDIAGAGAEEQLIAEEAQALVKDWLTCDVTFKHSTLQKERAGPREASSSGSAS